MHSRGFTLVEMLVVMTISAILIAAAVPCVSVDDRAQSHFGCDQSASCHISSTRAWKRRDAATPLSIVPNARSERWRRLYAAARRPQRSMAMTGRWVGSCSRKSCPMSDESNFEAGDQVIFRQQAMGAVACSRDDSFQYLRGRVRRVSAARHRRHCRRRQTFAIDLRHGADTDRRPIARSRRIALTNAARCIPITAARLDARCAHGWPASCL